MLQFICCSGCEYKREVYFSDRVYEVCNLTLGLPVLANLGWCFACRDCVAVEFVPDLAQLVDELAAERRKASGHAADNELPNNHLVWAEARVHWRRGRNSPARCLKCASTNIRELMNCYESRKGDILGEHPNCCGGGKLLVDRIGFVNYIGWTIYDAEGFPKIITSEVR